MKKSTLTLFFLVMCAFCFCQTVTADMVVGTWLTENGKAKVQIYKEGTKYNGKIVWLKDPNYDNGDPKVDKNNSDKTKQSARILGLNMLKGFVFDEDQWEDGTIYDPENGKTYSCKINYRNGKLDLRGYIGISLIGRTQTWFKVADIK